MQHHPLVRALTSAIFLIVATRYAAWSPLFFVALVPLLRLEDGLVPNSRFRLGKLSFYAFLAFGLWSATGYLWLFSFHPSGWLWAVLVNTLLPTLLFGLFSVIKQHLGRQRGYLFLLFGWLAMESLHKYWPLDFSWLQLGLRLHVLPDWLQFYSVLGPLGGSLWILAVNILFFHAARAWRTANALIAWWRLSLTVLIFTVPLLANRWLPTSEADGATQVVVLSDRDDAAGAIAASNTEKVDARWLVLGPEAHPDTLQLGLPDNAPHWQEWRSTTPDVENWALITPVWVRQEIKGAYSDYARSLPTGDYEEVYEAFLYLPAGRGAPQLLFAHRQAAALPRPVKPLFGPPENYLVAPPPGYHRQFWRATAGPTPSAQTLVPLQGWEAAHASHTASSVRQGAQWLLARYPEYVPGQKQWSQNLPLRAIENRRPVLTWSGSGIPEVYLPSGQKTSLQKQGKGWTTLLPRISQRTYFTRAGDLTERVSYFLAGFLLLFALVQGRLAKARYH